MFEVVEPILAKDWRPRHIRRTGLGDAAQERGNADAALRARQAREVVEIVKAADPHFSKSTAATTGSSVDLRCSGGLRRRRSRKGSVTFAPSDSSVGAGLDCTLPNR